MKVHKCLEAVLLIYPGVQQPHCTYIIKTQQIHVVVYSDTCRSQNHIPKTDAILILLSAHWAQIFVQEIKYILQQNATE